MHQRIITTAKVLDCRKEGKVFRGKFLIFPSNEIDNEPLSKEEYQKLKKKIGQQIQIQLIRGDYNKLLYLEIIPTFFDSLSRCKKCGRFFKIYCKSCHQKVEWTNMILDKFKEEHEQLSKSIS